MCAPAPYHFSFLRTKTFIYHQRHIIHCATCAEQNKGDTQYDIKTDSLSNYVGTLGSSACGGWHSIGILQDFHSGRGVVNSVAGRAERDRRHFYKSQLLEPTTFQLMPKEGNCQMKARDP